MKQVYLLTRSRKIDHIALPTKYNYQVMSIVDSNLIGRPRNVRYYHIFEL